MRNDRRAALVVLAGMAATAAGSRLLIPTALLSETRPAVDVRSLFPSSFGAWRVDDSLPVVLPSPDVQARLDQLYSQTLARTYISSAGARIMLSVAYGRNQSDTTQVHRPEVCYPSQGFQLLDVRDAHVGLPSQRQLPVRRVETRMGGRIEPVTYWVVVGEYAAVNRKEQKLAQLQYVVRGFIPDGMLVRVSAIDPDAQHSFVLQDEFIRQLYQAVPASMTERVFGRS